MSARARSVRIAEANPKLRVNPLDADYGGIHSHIDVQFTRMIDEAIYQIRIELSERTPAAEHYDLCASARGDVRELKRDVAGADEDNAIGKFL